MVSKKMIEENTCVDTTPKYTLPYLIIIISGEYMLKSTVIGSSQNKKKQTISIVRQLLTQTHTRYRSSKCFNSFELNQMFIKHLLFVLFYLSD